MVFKKYDPKLKREVEDRYIYDVILAYGCIGCLGYNDISVLYNIPIGTIKNWAYNRRWHKKRLEYLKILQIFQMHTIEVIRKRMGWDYSKWKHVNNIMEEIIRKRILVPLHKNRMKVLKGDSNLEPITDAVKEYIRILEKHLKVRFDLHETSKLLVGDLKNVLKETG
ncbi:MAG TPA: hypothetical protein VGD31_17360 [Sphingobacteriaceae bacterium]